jgi:uncharacterized Zn-finger protein
MSDINHTYTVEITCPWCGEVHRDSWERDDEGEDDCQECGKTFEWTRNITVEYSTSKKEEGK